MCMSLHEIPESGLGDGTAYDNKTHELQIDAFIFEG